MSGVDGIRNSAGFVPLAEVTEPAAQFHQELESVSQRLTEALDVALGASVADAGPLEKGTPLISGASGEIGREKRSLAGGRADEAETEGNSFDKMLEKVETLRTDLHMFEVHWKVAQGVKKDLKELLRGS
jgi:hypothetical protein